MWKGVNNDLRSGCFVYTLLAVDTPDARSGWISISYPEDGSASPGAHPSSKIRSGKERRRVNRYSHRFSVQAPLERVAEFHHDPKALKRLTPPPVFVQARRIEPMDENSEAEFTMWLGPIPVRWLAIHSDVDWRRGFTDTQAQGPFEAWVHRHTFHEISQDVTEVMDEIQASFGNGLWNGMVSRLMWWNLPVLFAFRAWKTRKYLEK